MRTEAAGSAGGNDDEGPHHVVVFMLDDVAVEDVLAGEVLKANEESEHVAGVDDGCIFPSGLAGGWWAGDADELEAALDEGSVVEALALEDLELNQMEMHGVGVVGGVDETPLLDGVEAGKFGDGLVVAFAIDEHAGTFRGGTERGAGRSARAGHRVGAVGEDEVARDGGLGGIGARNRGEGRETEGSRRRTREVDAELHELREGRVDGTEDVPAGIRGGCVVRQRDGFAFVAGEVDEEIGALGGGEEKLLHGSGSGEETAVAADLVEGNEGGDVGGALGEVEIEVEEAGVGGVENAEAIRARFDAKVRADGAVDDGQVAEELRAPDAWRKARAVVGSGSVDELTLVVEGAILEHERDFVVAGGKAEAELGGIAQEVKAG